MSSKSAFQKLMQVRKLGEIVHHKTPQKIKTDALPISKYGGRHIVTMLPGVGIGPEMNNHVREVLVVAQAPIDFEVIEGSGEDLVANAVLSLRRNRVGIKGNLENILADSGFIAPNVTIRSKLDLFVFVVHCKTYPLINARFPNLDLVIIRQNTEGEYAMLEHESVRGMVESMKIITRENTEKLAHFSFDYVRKNGRKKITVIHKSQDLILSDGMFLRTIQEIATKYPDVQLEEMHIDRCCQKLVQNPYKFDVLLMPNLYGTIISNIACGLAGGTGLYSGSNFGENLAVFETATRHIAKDLAGKNTGNPIALLEAAINMLRYLGKTKHAQLIQEGIHHTLAVEKIQTPDIGGSNTTSDLITSIKDYIVQNLSKYKT